MPGSYPTKAKSKDSSKGIDEIDDRPNKRMQSDLAPLAAQAALGR